MPIARWMGFVLGVTLLPAAYAGQEEIISSLTGNSDILPGLRLSDRASAENRDFARDYLAGLFTQAGYQPELDRYRSGASNVFARLESTTGSDETVVIGAHFDSVRGCAGANDNATGVAAVLGLAARLKELEHRNFDVIFVLFDEEELHLIGSKTFARYLKDAGVAVHSVHTMDQMGWDRNANRAIELELPTQGLLDFYRSANVSGGFNLPLWVTSEAGSDHSAFRAQGFPAVGLTEEYRNGDTTPFYHGSGDRYETIDFEYLRSTTRFWAYAVEQLLSVEQNKDLSSSEKWAAPIPGLKPEATRK